MNKLLWHPLRESRADQEKKLSKNPNNRQKWAVPQRNLLHLKPESCPCSVLLKVFIVKKNCNILPAWFESRGWHKSRRAFICVRKQQLLSSDAAEPWFRSVLCEPLHRRRGHQQLPPFLKCKSSDEPGDNYHLTELLVSGNNPDGGTSMNCLHTKWLIPCKAAHPAWLEKPTRSRDIHFCLRQREWARAGWGWFWWDKVCVRRWGKGAREDRNVRCGKKVER